MHTHEFRPLALLQLAAAALFLSTLPALALADQGSDLTQGQKDALKSHVAACDKLHGSKEDSCVAHARRDFARMDPSLSQAQKAALERDTARYQSALETCNKRPVSERNACKDEAGRDYRLAGL